jgi:hypothetical protein
MISLQTCLSAILLSLSVISVGWTQVSTTTHHICSENHGLSDAHPMDLSAADVLLDCGMDRFGKKDYLEARKYFQRIVTAYPNDKNRTMALKYLKQCDQLIDAEATTSYNPDDYRRRFVLIIQSTEDYASALKTAEAAAKKLGENLDLRGLMPHDYLDGSLELTSPKDKCEEQNKKFPCYSPRMGSDEEEPAEFVSIEYSNGYRNFQPRYYIVVLPWVRWISERS